MSPSQTPTGFSIRELYTRIIPGTLLLSALVAPFVLALLFQGSFSGLGEVDLVSSLDWARILFIWAVLSLIVGEIINTVRAAIETPHWFRLVVYKESDDTSDLGRRQRLILACCPSLVDNVVDSSGPVDQVFKSADVTEQNLPEHICRRLGLEFENASSRIIYLGLVNYMDTRMSSITKRHQVNYILSENVWLSIIVGLFFQGTALVGAWLSFITMPRLLLGSFALVAVVYLVLLVFWVWISAIMSQAYLEHLLIDFFTYDSDAEE